MASNLEKKQDQEHDIVIESELLNGYIKVNIKQPDPLYDCTYYMTKYDFYNFLEIYKKIIIEVTVEFK